MVTLLALVFLQAAFLAPVAAQTAAPGTKPLPTCNLDMLNSLGFVGKLNPDGERLVMCPQLRSTCCTKTDQIVMYENFVLKKEEEELVAKLTTARTTYDGFFEAGLQVHELAEALLRKYRHKRISNCKILAKRIVGFQVKKVFERLRVAIAEMHKFFLTSYKGVYCAACDGRNQQFWKIDNPNNKTVHFARGYCRDMLAKSVQPLIYLESYLPTLANLMVEFGSQCNSRNRFIDEPIDSHDQIKIKATRASQLEECLSVINHEQRWFERCATVCNRFNMLKLNPYFLPNVREFKKLTLLLKELPAKFRNPKWRADKPPQGRILEILGKLGINQKETKYNEETFFNFNKRVFEIQEKEVAEVERRFNSDLVIKSPDFSNVDWTDASPRFPLKGLDLYKAGQETAFASKLYRKILFSEENWRDNRSSVWQPSQTGESPEVQLHKLEKKLKAEEGKNNKNAAEEGSASKTAKTPPPRQLADFRGSMDRLTSLAIALTLLINL
jgi:hypothetical protein